MWYDQNPAEGVGKEFSKLSSPSLKDLFVQQLQGMILSGELPVVAQGASRWIDEYLEQAISGSRQIYARTEVWDS